MDEKSLEYEKLSKVFKKRMRSELDGKVSQEYEDEQNNDEVIETREYTSFKKQYMPKQLSLYEKVCQISESALNIKAQPKIIPKLEEAIKTCHLNVTPTGVNSAAFLIPLSIILGATFFFFILPVLLGKQFNLFFVLFFLMLGAIMIVPLQNLPFTFANKWRMKASNQIVLSIFYVVTYMRHTSNLERAINFAADHLPPPLSLDFRKVVWDVQTQKFDTIRDSLNNYLDIWREDNLEFIESMNLIESSLLESSEDRRLNALDKSLDVILDETYEKMIHYAHGLKGPLVTLNMLGVVLPILTLVLLPMVVSFMEGFHWYHLFALYNIALPITVYYLGSKILSKRPGGSGGIDIAAKNPELKNLKKIAIKVGEKKFIYLDHLYFWGMIIFIFCFVGFFPLIWNVVSGGQDYGLIATDRGSLTIGPIDEFTDRTYIKASFLEYRKLNKGGQVYDNILVGPFGLISVLLVLAIPFGIAFGVGKYNQAKSKNLIDIREKAKKLELEFSSALFQLGSRLGDGIPAEIAFGKVGSQISDTLSGKFFSLVHSNIVNQGMNVNDAIFNKKTGAINQYPSDIIESAMKVLVESSKKGPLVASQALINVSNYIKQMHRVEERLNDLMGDTVTSMRSQVGFLTPVISSIVVAITSLITSIMGALSMKLGEISQTAGQVGTGNALLGMFGTGIPTYYFTLVVGLYVIEISYVLLVIASGIENGVDDLATEHSIGVYLTKSVTLFTGLSVILIIIFSFVSGQIFASML